MRREHPRVPRHDAAPTSSPAVTLKPRHTAIARVDAIVGIEEAIDAIRHGKAPIEGTDYAGAVKGFLCALAFVREIDRHLLAFNLPFRVEGLRVFKKDAILEILDENISVLHRFGHRVQNPTVELWRGDVMDALAVKERLVNARLASQFERPACVPRPPRRPVHRLFQPKPTMR